MHLLSPPSLYWSLNDHRNYIDRYRVCRNAGRLQTPVGRDRDRYDILGLCPAAQAGRKTTANVTDKGEFRKACAELGLIFVAPDTSPRGEGVRDDAEGAYDFGLGAGFYVDATEKPFAKNYRMRSYIEDELPAIIAETFPADMGRQGIMGHSMGGHGALTISLRNPGRYRSTSAFAPIVSPMKCPWGLKALGGYLGQDQVAWVEYDACALIAGGARLPNLLVDQGDADNFLNEQLKTHLLAEACEAAGQQATIRMQPGYDHSYYFISTFMADQLAWHAARLRD
jgi:S-formylglutathione hydrolase